MGMAAGWGMGGDLSGWQHAGSMGGMPHMSLQPTGNKHFGCMSGGGGPAGSSLASGQSANTGLQAPAAGR